MKVHELIAALNDYPMDTEVDLIVTWKSESGERGNYTSHYKAPLAGVEDNPMYNVVNLCSQVADHE